MNKRSTIHQALFALSWMWHLWPIPTLTLRCAPMSQHLTRFAELWRSWRMVGQLAVTTYLLNYSSALHLTSVKHYRHSSSVKQIMANFVSKFPNFRYHGNKGRSQNIVLVHRRWKLRSKCGEDLSIGLNYIIILVTDAGHRTPETGHAKWFYILSNAAMHCIGQTMTTLINFFVKNTLGADLRDVWYIAINYPHEHLLLYPQYSGRT